MRDTRLDFFRGLAIYMIFVDHISGDPLSKFTYHSVGVSDAAEIFVFISGLACGIVYTRTIMRDGFLFVMQAITKRAARIYFYYALSSIAIILLLSSNAGYVELQDHLGVSAQNPLTAVVSVFLFVSPPKLSGLLILYIALTLVVVPPLLAAQRRVRGLLLSASGLIWLGVQCFPAVAAPITQHVYPNPLAWQFLFAIGVVVGIKHERQEPIFSRPSHLRWAIVAAWMIVATAFIYRVVSARSGLNIASLRLDSVTWASMKDNLSIVRLLHILSVALLISVYVGRDSAWLKWPISKPVIKTGMLSLEMFALSIVMTTITNILVMTEDPSFAYRLGADSIVFAVIAITASVLAHHRARALRQRLRA